MYVRSLVALGLLAWGVSAQRPSTSPGSTLQVGGHTGPVVIGDLNRDGKPDIVAGRADAGTVSVYLGDGRGRFSPSAGSPFAAGDNPEDFALGDFNEDGDLDLAVANHETTYVNVSIVLSR